MICIADSFEHSLARPQPRRGLDRPGARIAFGYRPFDGASGDIYSLSELAAATAEGVEPAGLWGIVVADVAGHGVAAAEAAREFHSLLTCQPCPGDWRSLPRLLSCLNQALCQSGLRDSFIATTAAVYDAVRRTITYSCAGQPPILVRRALPRGAARVERLSAAGGIPLGIDANATWDEATVQLSAGDRIVFVTDGIIEARSPDRRLLGLERLEAIVRRRAEDPAVAVRAIMSAVARHEAGAAPADDQTVVILDVL